MLGTLLASTYRGRVDVSGLADASQVAEVQRSVTAAMEVAVRTQDAALADSARSACIDEMAATLWASAAVAAVGAVIVAVVSVRRSLVRW